MKTIEYQGETYRLPFAELFRELNAGERSRLVESIKEHGIRRSVIFYDSPTHGKNCVIDGMNRLEIAVMEESIEYVPLEWVECDDDEALELALSLNRDRRHLSPEEQAAARSKRVERVAAARAEGKSLRTIADEVGVGLSQVQRDIEEAKSTVPGGTVEPKGGKVKGKDGKERTATPAKKPKAPEAEPETVTEVEEQHEAEERDQDNPPIDPRWMVNAEDAAKKAAKLLTWKNQIIALRTSIRQEFPDKNSVMAKRVDVRGIEGYLNDLIDTFDRNIPECVCPCCCGTGAEDDGGVCRFCDGYGIVDKHHHAGLKGRWKKTRDRYETLLKTGGKA